MLYIQKHNYITLSPVTGFMWLIIIQQWQFVYMHKNKLPTYTLVDSDLVEHILLYKANVTSEVVDASNVCVHKFIKMNSICQIYIKTSNEAKKLPGTLSRGN